MLTFKNLLKIRGIKDNTKDAKNLYILYKIMARADANNIYKLKYINIKYINFGYIYNAWQYNKRHKLYIVSIKKPKYIENYEKVTIKNYKNYKKIFDIRDFEKISYLLNN